MSSSMFIEPNDELSDKADGQLAADSNLVVVYGKTGVNIDPNDLEKLIEEKTVQSISVIRLTSPTPSMEDAEETARIEAEKDAQDLEADSEDQTDAEANESKTPENEKSDTDSYETETDRNETGDNDEGREDNASGNEDRFFKKRNRKLSRIKSHAKRKGESKKDVKPRTELVGLNFEGFYEAEAALEIAKEACKMAGIPYIRNTAEYETLLLVIKNDHCYTPFTSPEQMKAKFAADKIEAEKLIANARKLQPQINVQSKQLMMKVRKQPLPGTTSMLITKASLKKPVEDLKFETVIKEKTQIDAEDVKLSHTALDDLDEDEEEYELIDIDDSDYTTSEQSAESDNDRDSDLDFDVNNRKLKKRKIPHSQKKTRKIPAAKQVLEKRHEERTNATSTAMASPITINLQRMTPVVKSRIGAGNITITQRQVRAPQILPMDSIQKFNATTQDASKVVVNKLFTKPTISITPKLQRSPQIVQIVTPKQTAETSTRVLNIVKGQQNVKEIVLNKVMSSPKGGFTEISTLISAEEKSLHQQNQELEAISSPKPVSIIQHNFISTTGGGATTSRSGFMRIDAASKNQLPAQISLETHHSSNELAAEHDKQLDLIDSIVKNELNKSMEEEIAEKPSVGINENIPKIVEMLESTEKALESTKTINQTTVTTNLNDACVNNTAISNVTHVDDIDITHGLPEDLLQHVVKLIEDDKTLKEAVEKQMLEQSFRNDEVTTVNQAVIQQQQQHQQQQQQQSQKENNSSESGVGFSTIRTVHLAQPKQSNEATTMPQIPIAQPTTTKSIIQMSISNVSSPTSSVVASPSFTQKPVIRRDPIQIVRGNGRVITLPPIEAPTTRAKRRAQVAPSLSQQQPQTQQFSEQSNLIFSNESSLDSSMHSNTSFNATPTTIAMQTTTPVLHETLVNTPTDTKQREAYAKRRVSKEAAASASSAKGARKIAANKVNKGKGNAAANIYKQDDTEASESQGDDDDDPNKLWCICRQPHNNRFMICCDACGDWFHGKCVNVTKAMGRDMEQKGIEWSCPNCIKKRDEKKQRKLTDMLHVRHTNSQSSTDDKLKVENVMLKSVNTGSTTTTTVDTTKTFANIKKEAVEIKQVLNVPITTSQQTPTTTKKTPIVVIGQRKVVNRTPIVGQSKSKDLATNVHIKTTPQTSRSTAHTQKLVSPVIPAKTVFPTISCVVCKKTARPSSVYCSDECIRRCAQNAIHVITAKSAEQMEVPSSSSGLDEKKKKAKGLFEDLLSMADRKPKIERITVYDRKNAIKLSGSNAPTTMTIRKWLQDNPSFEIVLPGSQLSLEIEHKLQQQQQQQQQRTPTAPKPHAAIARAPISSATYSANLNKSIGKVITTPITTKEINASAGQSPVSPQTTVKTVRQIVVDEHNKHSSRPNTPKQLQKYPQQVQIKSAVKEETKTKERHLKRQSSESSASGSVVGAGGSSHKKSNDSASCSSNDSEPIRMSVRRTLKELIMQRIKESAATNEAAAAPKLTTEEVEAFVKETESEMYNFFGRDTGAKYKAKYRQLMFNIKDRKNRTLFAKICAKQIEGKQLVHMQPEELASQELAQWRENEQKHQLEMIKKSELEMLSCTKNYLFKNHKGEEVIEGKNSDICVNLDITTPVEDLVNVLNSSTTVGSSYENEDESVENIAKQLTSPITSYNEAEQEHYHQQQQHHHQLSEEKIKHRLLDDLGKEHRSKSKSRERDRDRDADRHGGSSRNKDEKDEKIREKREKRHRSRSRDRQRERHHRDKSRSRRRSHSRSKSRSRSQERRHKSSLQHKERDRERERERDKERERDYEKERKKSSANQDNKAQQHTSSKNAASVVVALQAKDKHRHSPIIVKQKSQQPPQQQQQQQQIPLEKKPVAATTTTPLECFNLIDQIIESSKTVEEAANLVKEKHKEKEKPKDQQQQTSSVVPTSSSSLLNEVIAIAVSSLPSQITSTCDSDQEPTSTVSIPTPPHDAYAHHEEPTFSRTNSPTNTDIEASLWTGSMFMNDVASLQINIQKFIGNSLHIVKLLPESLDVVGRIDNETVWEYLWKIRKSPNKEIILIRLTPLLDDEINDYVKLFNYLDQKKRLGVIKSTTPHVKDFYIYPLSKGKQLPKVLQVANQHDFYVNSYSSDILIGILVCVIGKRAPPTNASSNSSNLPSSSHFSSAAAAKLSRRLRTDVTESFTPPGSPKRKKRTHRTDIDIDAIIKAPIVKRPAATSSTTLEDDADEPYSPGGSSDDDVSMFTAKPPPAFLGLPSADDDLKRKMEEINRKIAAQEMEIAGLLNAEPTAASANVLANISIPSNLPQILASINRNKEHAPTTIRTTADVIQTNTATQINADKFEEYNPEEAMLPPTTLPYTASVLQQRNQPIMTTTTQMSAPSTSTSTSRLAQLSEAELLSMVPDDVLMEPAKTSSKQPTLSPYYHEPPPPGV